jgi:hypothetical protein
MTHILPESTPVIKMNVDLHVINDNGTSQTFTNLSPDMVTGYTACAVSGTGKHTLLLLTSAYEEWVINMTDRTVIRTINCHTSIKKETFTFDKLIIN